MKRNAAPFLKNSVTNTNNIRPSVAGPAYSPAATPPTVSSAVGGTPLPAHSPYPDPTPADLQHMLAYAKKRASKFNDDVRAEDLAQEGWLTYYKNYHLPEKYRWWRAWEAMMKAAWYWQHEMAYHPKRITHPNVTRRMDSLDELVARELHI